MSACRLSQVSGGGSGVLLECLPTPESMSALTIKVTSHPPLIMSNVKFGISNIYYRDKWKHNVTYSVFEVAPYFWAQ